MKHSTTAIKSGISGGRKGNGQTGPQPPSGDIYYLLASQSREALAQIRLAPEFKVIYANPAAFRIMGFTLEEFYEKPDLFKRIHPDDARHLKDILDPDSTFGQQPTIQRCIKKDGSTVWLEMVRTVIRDEYAGTVDAYFFCRDVTNRRLTQDALKESQKFISSLLENAPHATVVINPDTSIRYVNPTWEEINGWRLDEVIGLKAPHPWWPPEQIEQSTRNFKLVMQQEKGSSEVLAVKKNGERYWIAANWTSVTENGKMQYMLVNSIDITGRKRAEELKEDENRILMMLGQGAALKDLLEAIVRMGEQRDPSLKGSVLLLDRRKKLLVHAAGPSLPEAYLKAFTAGLAVGEGVGSCGTAAYRKERVVVPDIAASPHFAGSEIIEVARQNNMLACWSEPIISSKGELFGTIANYSNKVGEPSQQNLDILEWSARIAAIAIERRRAEEQVHLLSSVTEQISEATIVTDPNFKITYLNQAAQSLFGYTLEEALGKQLGLFNPKPIPKMKRRKILDVVDSGKVWTGIATKRRKDGRSLICDCSLSPLYDEEGHITSYIDVERDVTEQKEMELKLQQHKRLIESILSSLPEGVLVTDGRDNVVLANQAFHRILHVSRKTVWSRKFQGLLRINDLHRLYKSVRQGAAAPGPLEIRHRIRGQDRIIACNVVRMDGGRMLLIFSDVSQERENKEKLYLTDRLASLGEMAAGLAHELNNPLTAILTLSQLLLHHGLPGESQEDMKCIYEEAQRATRIVKNVILFARNNNYEHGSSSVNDVVKDVLRLRQYDVQAGDITVVTNFAESLPEVSIDRYRLQQVFLNIILNAEAAVNETGRKGVLTVTTELADGLVRTHIADNGCGIKKSVIQRIFDPFFTTKEVGKGTGLGLSICYGIVTAHGGNISVHSKAGQGATFTVEIPVARA